MKKKLIQGKEIKSKAIVDKKPEKKQAQKRGKKRKFVSFAPADITPVSKKLKKRKKTPLPGAHAKENKPPRKRRVSFTHVDLHEFEQRVGKIGHGVPEEGASLFMGKLISSSPKVPVEKFIAKRDKEREISKKIFDVVSPDIRKKVAFNKVTKKELDAASKETEKIHKRRSIFGCTCLPPKFMTVAELKQKLKKSGCKKFSKLNKPKLIKMLEKKSGKSCCQPGSGCECTDNGIGCYSESCSCLSVTGTLRFCKNEEKKMFNYPPRFTSRKTKKILKEWEQHYTEKKTRKIKRKKKVKNTVE